MSVIEVAMMRLQKFNPTYARVLAYASTLMSLNQIVTPAAIPAGTQLIAPSQ